MRISDAERERVAQVLLQAMSEGRLTASELDERLGSVYAARTYGELEPVTRDLPVPAAQPSARPARVEGTATSGSAVAVFGGSERRGRWVVPAEFSAVAVFGGVVLDLREAQFAAQEIALNAVAVFGGIEIVVPEGISVRVEGTGIMGGFDRNAEGEGLSGAPVVRISGIALMGGVSVRRKPHRTELER
jgi:Domain of unknown function (DUF1707)/Cell wall-active antibiotics response 4TMS YvqF